MSRKAAKPDATNEGAQSSFAFEAIGVTKLVFTEVQKVDSDDDKATLAAGGSLKHLEQGKIDVELRFRVGPHPKRPYVVEIDVVGRFSSSGSSTEELHQFCTVQAPSIMFPYVRHYINTASSMGRFGGIVLPLMNMQAVFPPDSWKLDGQNPDGQSE